jgi:hypothetical protein
MAVIQHTPKDGFPGSYDANGLWQITPGATYTGALPDTATVLNYGTFYNGRADRTIPMDSARRWLRGNIISNERIMDINDVNKYVITLYSSPSTVPVLHRGQAAAQHGRKITAPGRIHTTAFRSLDFLTSGPIPIHRRSIFLKN